MSRFTVGHFQELRDYSVRSPLRVIALIDLDGFYAQCETIRLGLDRARPLVVRQWNAIIAMNYPAKYAGIKRGMPVDKARQLCADVFVQHVATWKPGQENWGYHDDVEENIGLEKSALDPYRAESAKILRLICEELSGNVAPRVERASVDEFYVDLSRHVYEAVLEKGLLEKSRPGREKNEHLPVPGVSSLDWADDTFPCAEHQDEHVDWDLVCLSIGAQITRTIRQKIFTDLKYTCSAGIARNKTLAKLGAGHKKPNGQVVVLPEAEKTFVRSFNINKVAGFKGKLGAEIIDGLGMTSLREMADLEARIVERKLGSATASILRALLDAIDLSPVVIREINKSYQAQKLCVPNLETVEEAEPWLRSLAHDLVSRMDLRREQTGTCVPGTLNISLSNRPRAPPTARKQMPIPPVRAIDEDRIVALAKQILERFRDEIECWPCATISMGVSNFDDRLAGQQGLKDFFVQTAAPTHPGGVKETTSDEAAIDDGQYVCPHCHHRVPEAEVLEHLDWHVARNLSDTKAVPTKAGRKRKAFFNDYG